MKPGEGIEPHGFQSAMHPKVAQGPKQTQSS